MNVLTQIPIPKKARITQIILVTCRVKIMAILFTSRFLLTLIVNVKKAMAKENLED